MLKNRWLSAFSITSRLSPLRHAWLEINFVSIRQLRRHRDIITEETSYPCTMLILVQPLVVSTTVAHFFHPLIIVSSSISLLRVTSMFVHSDSIILCSPGTYLIEFSVRHFVADRLLCLVPRRSAITTISSDLALYLHFCHPSLPIPTYALLRLRHLTISLVILAHLHHSSRGNTYSFSSKDIPTPADWLCHRLVTSLLLLLLFGGSMQSSAASFAESYNEGHIVHASLSSLFNINCVSSSADTLHPMSHSYRNIDCVAFQISSYHT